MTLSRSRRPIVRGYHSSSQPAVTSRTSVARDAAGDLDDAAGFVDLGDDVERGDVGGEVPPGELEVALLPREDHPGHALAPGPQPVDDRAVDRDDDAGSDDDEDEVLDGEGQGPPDEGPSLLDQPGEGEVGQRDEAAGGKRQPGRPRQHRRTAEPRLALVQPAEVERRDEDQRRDGERQRVGTERVRRPARRPAEAVEHRDHRQPEDGEPVEEHDEPEATAVQAPEEPGLAPGARLGHGRLGISGRRRPDGGRPGSGRRARTLRPAPRATRRAPGRGRRARPRGR